MSNQHFSKFFFHFSANRKARRIIEDHNGQELPDIEAAREEARRIARELAQGGEVAPASIVVTDGEHILFEIDVGRLH
jgi:hypothetical protein